MDNDILAEPGAAPARGRARGEPRSDDGLIRDSAARQKPDAPTKVWILATLAWAVVVSAAARSEPAAAWLAIGTIAFAPLALAILVARAPERRGFMVAADAEALAWSQPGPPPESPRKGHAAPVSVRRGAQPLTA